MPFHALVKLIEDPNGGYTIYSPTYPSCVTEGETVGEAIENFKEAFALFAEDLKMASMYDNVDLNEENCDPHISFRVVSIDM